MMCDSGCRNFHISWKISEPAVSLSVKRGMKIAEENQYLLFDDTNLWTDVPRVRNHLLKNGNTAKI